MCEPRLAYMWYILSVDGIVFRLIQTYTTLKGYHMMLWFSQAQPG